MSFLPVWCYACTAANEGPVSVRSQSSAELDGQTQLVFGMEASFELSYSVL